MSDALKSFGLKTRKRKDGRLDIVGKDDAGKEYVAHVAHGAEVTPADIQRLADSDRTRNTPKEYVERELSRQRAIADAENPSMDEWVEAAMPVAEAGLGVARLGWSRKYARAFERIKWDTKSIR